MRSVFTALQFSIMEQSRGTDVVPCRSASARRRHDQGIGAQVVRADGRRATVTCGPSCRPAAPGRGSGPSAAPPGPSSCSRCSGERSLLQQTIDRLAPSVPPERTLVVCGPAHAAPVARQLPALPERNIVVEPSPRGSGPAIALATALIARRDPAAIVGSFAADHEVSDLPLFDAALRTAVAAAR